MQVARFQLLDLRNYGLRDRNHCRLKFLTLIFNNYFHLRSFRFFFLGHFNSLPRHIQLGGESINGGRQPQPRNRKQVNNALQDYLKSLNSMTRSIVLETETVEKEHQCEWKKMDDAKREEVVNDHFIPADIRFHYDFADYGERAPSCCSFTSSASWGGRHHTPSLNSFSMDNGPTHLSQPSDWEQWPSANVNTVCGAPLALQRGRGGDGLVRSNLSRSNNDLLQRNQWQQSTAHVSHLELNIVYLIVNRSLFNVMSTEKLILVVTGY